MDKTLYTDGMPVEAADLNNTHDTKEAALKRRVVELGLGGVTDGLTLEARPYKVAVLPGVAYLPGTSASAGERVELRETVELTVGRGKRDGVGMYVAVRVIQQDGDYVAHPTTGVLTATLRSLIGEAYLSRSAEAASIILGQVTGVDRDGYPSFSLTSRQEWSPTVQSSQITDAMMDPGGSVMEHVAARGTGYTQSNAHGVRLEDLGWTPDMTPQTHQARDHVDGIEQAGSTAGLVLASGYVGYVNITQITGSDSIVIDGARLLAGGIANTTLSWSDGDANPGLYEVWLQKPTEVGTTGTVGKTLRAIYVNPRACIGVQIVDVDPDHDLGPFTLVMTYAGGVRTLRWDDGVPVTIGSSNQLYTLAGKSGNTVVVYVSVADLLTVGNVDVIEIYPSGTGRTRFWLSSLFWFGSASGRLGYGAEGVGGTNYDRRVFGSVSEDNLSTLARYEMGRIHRELRRDGWVEGGNVDRTGKHRVLIRAGVVWIDGVRRTVRATEMDLPLSAVSIIIVDLDGHVQALRDDPDGVHVSEPMRFARVARVTCDSVDILTIQDDRTILSAGDSMLRLGAGLRHNVQAQVIPRLMIPQGPFGAITNQRRGRTRWLYCQEPLTTGYGSQLPVNIYWTHYKASYTKKLTLKTSPRPTVGFEIAINCVWVPDYITPGVSVWMPVNQYADAIVYGFDTDGMYVRHKQYETYSTRWYDSAADGSPTWSDEPFKTNLRDGTLTLKTASLTVNDAMMAQNWALTNSLTPANMIKAWAVIDVTANGMRVLTGFNVQSKLVDVATVPHLYLASAFDGLDANTPRCAVLTADDRGMHSPNMPKGEVIRGQMVLVGGSPAIKFFAEGGATIGVSSTTIKAETLYVVVMGTQTSVT